MWRNSGHPGFWFMPLANLHLSLLDKLGIPIERMGNSTGRLEL